MNKNKEVKREFLCSGLQVREAEEGQESRTITGYAILFNTPSAPFYESKDEVVRETIAPEAITKELLDTCDIKMTMFHDRQLILARSNKGKGTLTYHVDEKGVSFEFDAPHTADGDKALELVKRGDLSGCSFAFRTHYYDNAFVERSVEKVNGKSNIECRVKVVTGIYDFTLAADPAYPATSVEAREIVDGFHEEEEPKPELSERAKEQIEEMEKHSNIRFKKIV